MDFVSELGLPFLAHRFRRLSELLLDGAADWMPATGYKAPARAGSTLLLLKRHGPLGITDIATRLKLTHPLIIKLTDRLLELGFVRQDSDPADGRRRLLSLTPEGMAEAARLEAAMQVIAAAYAEISGDVGVDLLALVEAIEAACAHEPMAVRLARLSPAKEPA